MAGLEEGIRSLSPGALRLFKQQLPQRLKQMSELERNTALESLSRMPEFTGLSQPTAQPPTQPQASAQPDQPLWAKGLQAFGAPFQWVTENVIQPGLGLFVGGGERQPDENIWEFQRRQWKELEMPEMTLPWTSPMTGEKARLGLKETIETLPWFAIPSFGAVGRAGMAGRGLAGMAGRAAPKLGGLAPVVKGAGFALEYSPWGLAEKGLGVAMGVAGRAVIPPGVKIVGKVLRIPRTQTLLNAAKTDVLPATLLKVPGARKLLGAIKASWTADDPIKAAKVIQGQMEDMSEAGLVGTLARAKNINPNIKIKDGIVIDPLIKQLQKLPDGKMSMAIHDIVEYAPRYAMKGKGYRAFINEIRAVSKSFSKMAKAENLKIRQIKGEADFAYLHRVVISVKEESSNLLAGTVEATLSKLGVKMVKAEKESAWEFLTRFTDDLSAGKIKSTPEIDSLVDEIAGIAEIKNIRGMINRPRAYDLVADGMKAGVKYADDPIQELRVQGEQVYKMVIKKRVGELMEPFGVLPKTRVPIALVESREAIVGKRLALRQMTQLIQRSQTGVTYENMPGALWRGIKKFYPEQYQALRETIKEGASLDDFTDFIVSQTDALKSEFRIVAPKYQLALAKAKIPKPEEGMLVGIPGISGRIIPTQIIGGKKVLGKEIAQEISKTFGWAPPGVAERWLRGVGAVGGVMRMGKASLDMSAQFIQTLPVLGIDFMNLVTSPAYVVGLRRMPLFGMINKPSAYWAKGVVGGIKAAIHPATAEAGYWANPVNRFFLQESAKLGALIQPSELTELFGPTLSWIGKRPVVGGKLATAFQQTYGRAEAMFTATRNITANEYRKGMWQTAKAMGQLPELAKASNLLTGVLSTKGMGISNAMRSLESGLLFFSPRFTRSVPALFGHMLAHPTSWTGAEAMKAMTGLMSATTLFFSGASMALGQVPKLNPLPKSQGGDGAEWLTVKIGGRNIGLGGILSDIRAAAGLVSQAFDDPSELLAFDMSNPVFRRLRGKLAPPTALFYDYMNGRDYIGNRVRGESLFPTHETVLALGKLGLPIWVEGMVEEGISLPAILGEFFGGRTFPESTWDIYKTRMLELSGKRSVKDISYRERVELDNKYPELVQLKEAAQDEMNRRGYNPVASEYWDRRDDSLKDRIQTLEEVQKWFDAGKIDGASVRRIIQDTGLALGTQYKMLETDPRYVEVISDMDERSKEKTKEALEKGWGVDLAYQRYWDIMFDPKYVDAIGRPMYTERDMQVDALRREVGENVWTELQDWIKEQQQRYPFIVRQYYDAQETLKPYWQKADEVWASYSPELRQISDQIERLESTDSRSAKRLLFQYPAIVMARKRIAIEKKRMRLGNPQIDQALRMFY